MKYGHLVVASATTCLISLLFVVTLQYLSKNGKIKQLEWDISTVTAADYTVEFVIPADAYQNWYLNTYKSYYGEFGQGYSPALSLKRHMIEVIEGVLAEEVVRKQGSGFT